MPPCPTVTPRERRELDKKVANLPVRRDGAQAMERSLVAAALQRERSIRQSARHGGLYWDAW